MSNRIHFIDSGLCLVHIPLHLYSTFLQPLLKLVFAEGKTDTAGGHGDQTSSWSETHPFLNISVTPIECSVVCSRYYAEKMFGPMLALPHDGVDKFSISAEDYVVMQVDGDGLDAGRRVLELTSPLAFAGISIFFITTYFSDYILFPTKARNQVVAALKQRGFVFEGNADASANHQHHRNGSSQSSLDALIPQSPLPTDLQDLQRRTFRLLAQQNITPVVHPHIRLILCAAGKQTTLEDRSASAAKLQLGLVRCLVQQPQFLSLTLTTTDPAALLIEKALVAQFQVHPEGSGTVNDHDGVLLGSMDDVLIPITLDLRGLPFDSTGIVCGVASRLADGSSDFTSERSVAKLVSGIAARLNLEEDLGPGGAPELDEGLVEMSYLSTARAGTVMVGEREFEKTTEALRGGQEGVGR